MPTSSDPPRSPRRPVYLIDTNVVSEARKRDKADPGVLSFFRQAARREEALYLSVVSVGELRRGIELIRRRGDEPQARQLESWLTTILDHYQDNLLDIGIDAAQVWGRLRAPDPAHEVDKLIAATAWVHDLTVVTRNEADFTPTGVRVLNPFSR